MPLLGSILDYLQPAITAFFTRNIPFSYRWRLLVFQPLAILISLLNDIPYALSHHPKTTIYIPVRNGRKTRALLYFPPSHLTQDHGQRQHLKQDQPRLRPLHLDIHGGAFMGGNPESGYRFCTYLSDNLDTTVVSTSYRLAPRHSFPAAIDDIDDVVDWLLENAKDAFNADMTRFTIGGSSAGGNLALATCLRKHVRERVKRVLTFYAPIDLTRGPAEKPRPAGFPKYDPSSFMFPLYDSYALSGRRAGYADDARLSPCLAGIEQLPDKVLMVVPMIDILPDEQLRFAERINEECEALEREEKIELMVMENCFHGWLELPSFAIKGETRTKVFERCAAFINEAHQRIGVD